MMTAKGVPDLSLIADIMCEHDAVGRLIGGSPHLYVLRSAESVICRFHADLSETVIAKLADVVMRARGRQRDWERDHARCVEILCASGLKPTALRAGPLYVFPDELPHGDGCVHIEEADEDVPLGGLDEWRSAIVSMQPFIAMFEANQIVSVCASVRPSDAIHVAGVETLPSCRRRGLGSRVVSGWANAVRARGAVPLYSTTFDNIPSQALACRLGLIPKASEFSIS